MERRSLAIVGLAVMLAACTSSPRGAPAEGQPSDRSTTIPMSTSPSPASAGLTLPASAVHGRVVASDDDVFSVKLPTGSIRAVTRLQGDQFDADAFDKLIAFRDSREGVNIDDEIWILDLVSRRLRDLSEAPRSNEWSPAWSPDGSQIAFSSDRGGSPHVYVMDPDGSNVRRLSDGWGEYPAWSPDGSAIAYASYMGGTTPFGDPDYDVFVMGANGHGARDLTNDPNAYDMYPTWSPDGARIAFESTRGTPGDFEPPSYDTERRSDMDIWVMDADGSDPRNLTNDVEHLDSFPDWSPRRLIVYDREGGLVILDPDTGARFDLTAEAAAPLERFSAGFPAWWAAGT
jgi:Tol biopolymer transport system component